MKTVSKITTVLLSAVLATTAISSADAKPHHRKHKNLCKVSAVAHTPKKPLTEKAIAKRAKRDAKRVVRCTTPTPAPTPTA
jgi:hypothetical protein